MGDENVTEPTGSPYDEEIAALERIGNDRTREQMERLGTLYELDEVWQVRQGRDPYS